MAMAGADPLAIMKATGDADMKTTMIYVSLGKSHIRDRVEKLNAIPLLAPPTSKMKALPLLLYSCRVDIHFRTSSVDEKDGADGPVLQNDAVHPVMTSATS